MTDRYDRQERRSASSSQTRGTHSKRSIFRRTVLMMVVCGVLMFIPLGWKLWDIAILHHEEYQQKATQQQNNK